ncbi:MAG: glycoside hydrolase family 5 [Candidatus Neomarinimicrobiota bacterium]|nr:MAG: glycoside hydrolase family 5 [Candidatus Neomarinimicrobiota bacterium]
MTLFFIQSSFAYLHTQGKEIVDSNGNPVLLRGIGLGGWLVPEGYMLHIPGYGSPTSIRNRIVDLIGEEDTEQFYEIYRANYVNEGDIILIAEWGFNSIRLPFNYRLLSPEDQPGVFLKEGFQVIDSLLIWCERNNLYLILDMHCAPGGQNPDNISDSDGEAKLWTIPANQTRTVEIWREIAERYADEEWIGGYDLLNEPVLPQEYDNSHLRSLYIQIRNAIREVDNNHIIFIEGNWYATDFFQLTPQFDVNMVYSFHKYWSETNQSSIQNYITLRNNYNVPLWLGESGENSNSWFFECKQLMEDNNIGWCWWTHKKIETVTSPLSSPIYFAYQQVLDYWNGQAPRPSSAFAKAALYQMAGNLAIEKCEYHLDVVASLFEDDFGNHTKPFKNHEIPGTINCVDYDLGINGVAYSDKDFERTNWDWSVYQPWNIGEKYRNDGVDIEESENSSECSYNIGWIESDEWIKYTVNILHSGNYNIVFRVASSGDGGRFRLLLNGQNISGDISVPNTGGWQNWQSISTNDIGLSEGEKVIELYFITGGFNISSMQFVALGNGLFEEVDNYALVGKNYPNPFNTTTTIPLILADKTQVNLTIYDLNGNLVITLVDSEISSGVKMIKWNGKDNHNKNVGTGIYFYRVRVDNKCSIKSMLLLK